MGTNMTFTPGVVEKRTVRLVPVFHVGVCTLRGILKRVSSHTVLSDS